MGCVLVFLVAFLEKKRVHLYASSCHQWKVYFLISLLFFWNPWGCKQKLTGAPQDQTNRDTSRGADNPFPASSPIPETPPSFQEPPTAKDPRMASIGVLKTAPEDYVNPMISGRPTSGWCVCRNVGTSPHIGWDLGFSISRKSIAMANGVIRERRLTSSACGWELILEDTLGTRWRYLHLNEPSLKAGTVVYQGTVMGIHQAFPRAGCGTGPHLHLERKSKGGLAGSERFRNCTGQTRSCQWDPQSHLADKKVLVSESEALGLVEKNKLATQKAKETNPKQKTAYSNEQNQDLSLSENHSTDLVWLDTIPAECPSVQPPPDDVALLEKIPESIEVENLIAKIEVQKRAERRSLLGLHLQMKTDPTDQNACGPGRCIVAWELFARTGQGWVSVLAEQGLRDSPVEVPLDSQFCWPQGFTGEWRLQVVTELQGQTEILWKQGTN
jgi:murein DD-endopeptidase MepM/ murein hydrolase activator NlpD